MAGVRLTVTKSNCRCGYHKEGQVFFVEDLCPPLCHELWHAAYPFVYALLQGCNLDCGEEHCPQFSVACPDGGRVVLRGERVDEATK